MNYLQYNCLKSKNLITSQLSVVSIMKVSYFSRLNPLHILEMKIHFSKNKTKTMQPKQLLAACDIQFK